VTATPYATIHATGNFPDDTAPVAIINTTRSKSAPMLAKIPKIPGFISRNTNTKIQKLA
jgi:hypothetical protein